MNLFHVTLYLYVGWHFVWFRNASATIQESSVWRIEAKLEIGLQLCCKYNLLLLNHNYISYDNIIRNITLLLIILLQINEPMNANSVIQSPKIQVNKFLLEEFSLRYLHDIMILKIQSCFDSSKNIEDRGLQNRYNMKKNGIDRWQWENKGEGSGWSEPVARDGVISLSGVSGAN